MAVEQNDKALSSTAEMTGSSRGLVAASWDDGAVVLCLIGGYRGR